VREWRVGTWPCWSCRCGSPAAGRANGDVLIDHQVRLLRAPDSETAYMRALALGAAERRSYHNVDGEEVVWEFVGLADLDVLQERRIADGSEIYSWRSQGDPSDAVVPK
jgi:hypothetical protein